MPDFRLEIGNLERSVDSGLRDLVRFGTAEQAEQAHRAREKLRFAQMDQALASLDSRNAAIVELVASLQSVVNGLRSHPVGDALTQFRDAVADGQLLLDRLQRADDEEGVGTEPPPADRPAPAPARPSSPTAPSATTSAAASGEPARAPSPKPSPDRPPTPAAPAVAERSAPDGPPAAASAGLKLPPANERFRDPLLKAASRCGLAPAALAALIDAEAAKLPNGGWDPNSANPRSSARGLTQFLSATWLDMASKPGTFLNELCRSKGLVDSRNAPVPARRAELLDLRFDPEASIVTAGDFASGNLSFLATAGCIAANATDDDKARVAYLAHHEGPAGARAFITRTLPEERAERLLRVNAGSKAPSLRAEHGSWRSAYEAFLNAYIDRKIQPARFRP